MNVGLVDFVWKSLDACPFRRWRCHMTPAISTSTAAAIPSPTRRPVAALLLLLGLIFAAELESGLPVGARKASSATGVGVTTLGGRLGLGLGLGVWVAGGGVGAVIGPDVGGTADGKGLAGLTVEEDVSPAPVDARDERCTLGTAVGFDVEEMSIGLLVVGAMLGLLNANAGPVVGEKVTGAEVTAAEVGLAV